jgi:hypothetical protein
MRGEALVAVVLIAGCGGDDDFPLDPCLECGPDLCYLGTRCSDGGCETEPIGCSTTCAGPEDCGEGHACVTQNWSQVCSLDCDSTLCADRRECRSGACSAVDCGFVYDCLDDTTICDAWAHRCYPFDGSCATVSECPHFDGRLEEVGVTTCDGAYCRVAAQPTLPIPGLEPDGAASVQDPSEGATFASASEMVIRWAGPPGVSIVLVVAEVPESASTLLDSAIWGASVAEGGERELVLADGDAVSGGAFQHGTAAVLPTGTPLFVYVEIISGSELVAVSPLVPFMVGDTWPASGDPCAAPGNVPGDCWHPTRLQGCSPADDRCRVVCLSYRDCLDAGLALDCGQPHDGIRYCE